MYVEIAEIDMDGWRSTIHQFDGVTDLQHERESPDNDWTASMTLTMSDGSTETVKGRGYGLEVVQAASE